MAKKDVYIDRIRCKGCGACEEVAPEAFEMDEGDDVALLKDVDQVPDDKIEQAATVCPVKCIEIEEQ